MAGRPKTRMARWTAIALGLVAAQWLTARPAAAANEAAIRREFAQAMQFYKSGQLKEAAEALDRVLAMDPTADLALQLRDQIGYESLFKMLNSQDRKNLSKAAKRLLDLAEKGVMAKKADTQTIQAQCQALADLDAVKRWTAIRELQAIGDAAVPFLLDVVSRPEKIAYSNQSKAFVARSAALIALRRMGRMATMPLIQALKSRELNVAQTAASLLGEANDPRAAAALKAVLERPKADALVQKAAAEALAAIAHAPVDSLPHAEEMYRVLAQDYLRNRFVVTGHIGEARAPFWSFNAKGKTVVQQIVYKMVPMYVYNFQVAQDACYEGVAINPEHIRLASMILYNYFSMRAQFTALVKSKGVLPTGIRATGFSLKDAQARLQALTELDVLAMVPGKSILYDVLQMATEPEANPSAPGDALRRQPNLAVAMLAVKALEALRDSRPERELSPLAGLAYAGTPSLRYAAANALVTISPSGAMLPSDAEREAVVSTLAGALSDLGKPAVLLVSQDRDVRERFAALLAQIGYTPLTAVDGPAALKMTKPSIPRISLVLVADDLTGFAAPAFGKTMKADTLAKDIPLVLLTTPGGGEKAGAKPAEFAAAVSKDIDAKPLAAKLAQTLAKDKPTQALIRNSRETVQEALAALKHVDPAATGYAIGRLTPALTALLQGQPMPIRLAACEVLEPLADPAALEALAAVFVNPKSGKALRLAAGRAIGRIIVKDASLLTDDMRVSFAKVLDEKDRGMRLAAGRLLGQGAASRDMAMKVLSDRRIQ